MLSKILLLSFFENANFYADKIKINANSNICE